MLFVNKLKVLTLMTCLVLVGQAFAAGEKCAANTTWGGFKTEIASQDTNGYYEIDTPAKLAWFSCEITKTGTSSQKVNAKLTKSIDLQGKLFIPISAGKGTPSYGGIFDGQGFTIKNLFIKGSEIVKAENGGKDVYAQNIGLFAALKGGTVKNVTLTNVEIYAASSAGDAGTSGKDNPISVGAIAGFVEAGTISGCAASGKIETSGATNRVGGIAGNVWTVTISNCISEVNIYATGDNTHVGGIVGVVRDKTGKVTLNSCVYAGETLFSNNGSAGAVAGQYEKKEDITSNDLYYTSDYPAVGTGLGDRPFDSKPVENLNTEDVICELNGGTWNTDDQTCSGASADGIWSEGQNNLSMNGSDGFKVTFDANGGNFTGGAKISKFFAKKASITANEIENPKYTGYKFVGWSLTQTGAVEDLGIADKAKTVYAVWKPIRTITFNAAPGAFDGGSSETSKLVAEGDVVTVEGLPALPVKFCSQETADNCDKYAYFHGWSTISHAPYGEDENIPEESIVDLPAFEFKSDTTLYAVWVESETYTVTFNANGHGQTKVAFVKVGKGETTVQPPDPNADDGYVFSGRWCKVAPCDEKTKFGFDTTEIDTSIILYADWEISEYDITYIIDGDTNTETGNQAKYSVESDPITLVKPDSAGYVFDGWYDEDGNEATTIRSGSTENKTFRGSWVPVTYTITYLADNTLSATTTSDEKEHGVAKTLKGATFAHGGCTQDGWSKVSYGKEGYNLDFVVNGSYEEDKDLILFPHWNCGMYNITYEVYGMSVTNRNPGNYTGPAKITLENAFDPAKKYFFMDNWYKEPTFKTVIRDIQNIDADLTVYARWYNKITYKPGSKVSGAKDSVYKKFFNTAHTFKSSISTYVRANYTLDGWSTTDGGDKVYELGGKYNTNENLTLYPHWVADEHTITYNNVDPSELPEGYPETYTHEASVTLPVPTRNGYEFLGWFVDGEFNGDAVIEIPEDQTEDKVFFAKWTPTDYTITYVLEEGASNDNDNPASYTVETEAITLKDAVKNGYTFEGWFNGEGEKVTTVAGGATGNLELTAQFTIETYTITYHNVEGASFETSNPATYTVDDLPIVLNKPAKAGYTFEGWFTDESFSGNPIIGIDTKLSEGNGDLYAKWSDPIEYTISYVIDDEAAALTPNGFTVVDYVTLAVPEMDDGYIFDGWYLDEEMTGEKVTSFEAGTYAANQTFYGKTIRSYTITYVDADGLENSNPTSYTVLENDLVLQPVSKSGFKFLGWFNENDELVESISAGSTGDITLTAKWAEFPIVTQYGGVAITEYEDGTKLAEIDENNFDSPIEITEDISVNTVVFNRVFKENTPSTIMLPFSIPMSEVEGGKFYGVTLNFSDGLWSAKAEPELSGFVQANTPYLYKPTSTTISFNNTDPVVFNTNGSRVSYPHAEWTFKGVYSYKKFEAEDPELGRAYGFAGKTVNGYAAGEFVMAGAGAWLNPMRCYLVHNAPVTAKSAKDSRNKASLPETIKIEFYDENAKLVDVGVWDLKSGKVSMDRWFDLHGRLLKGKPTAQGTYYHNGKRVIVK